ncbi:hypothetical protein CRE_12355 [Caenorhabditis remanei]|uniref:Uncharacterized protein n=1 Tax=Caenorhabditis remanei TaxID=31234 RepID=E3NL63_CAERE|nr:hypothetical protein CRE_12355 [Caenorhabditis remanei]
MLRFSILLCLLASICLSSAYNNRNFDQLEYALEQDTKALSRPRRVPAPEEARYCRKRMLTYIFSICEKTCDSMNGKDIATECCGKQCSPEFVRLHCCPSTV